MEQKPDWAQIEDEDDDGQYDEQEEGQQQQSTNTGSTTQGTYQPRPQGAYTGRGGRGGRGSRGGRGTRGGNRGGNRGGDRADFRPEGRPEGRYEGRTFGDKPQGPRESQPKSEMVSAIKHSQEKTILINLFNVDYNAKDDDIRNLYKDVVIREINQIKPGLFLLDLDNEEALKFVEIGTKAVNNRPFFMKIGFANKRQNPDEQWHEVNKKNHKFDVGQREDRQKRTGGNKPYNRREQNDGNDEGFYGHQKTNFTRQPKEEGPIDTDNKFFKGHDLSQSEYKPRFVNSGVGKKEEGEAKLNKPSPFGDAKARDESEFVKREDEKNQVKDLQEHFEEKKDEIAKDAKNLTTPVNSPNTEFVEGEGKPNVAAPPGIKGGQPKTSGFRGNQGQKAPIQNANQQKEKPKSKTTQKFNIFDALEGEEEDDE